jgi:hypothetical protein
MLRREVQEKHGCADTGDHNRCVFFFILPFSARMHRVKMAKKLNDPINVAPVKFCFLIIPKV